MDDMQPAIAVANTPCQTVVSKRLEDLILDRLRAILGNSFVDLVAVATEGTGVVVGGAPRDILLAGWPMGDIDIMFEGNISDTYVKIISEGYDYEVNRHGIKGFYVNGYKVDVFSPEQFQTGFDRIENAVKFFDMDINMNIISVSDKNVIKSNIVNCLVKNSKNIMIGINRERWMHEYMNEEEYSILLTRLANVMARHSCLSISKKDRDFLSYYYDNIYKGNWSLISFRTYMKAGEILDTIDRNAI